MCSSLVSEAAVRNCFVKARPSQDRLRWRWCVVRRKQRTRLPNRRPDAFQRAEDLAQDYPLPEGPYATLLKKLARLQERLQVQIEYSPVRIALVTARNSPAEMRAIKTLRHWGVYVNEAFFLGGLGKHQVLEAFKPHIFFDDQDIHLEKAAGVVPSGKVPYRSDSHIRVISTESAKTEKAG